MSRTIARLLLVAAINVPSVLRAADPQNEHASFVSNYDLTQEEREQSAGVHDEDGALYKVLGIPTSRKQHLLGRPTTFILYPGIRVPFRNYLLNRNLGPVTKGIELPGTITQVAGLWDQGACTISRDGEASPAILFFNKQLTLARQAGSEVRLIGHKEAPWRLLFDPQVITGRLVSCSDDGTIRLWDIEFGGHGGDRARPISRLCSRR